jgi:hypothetical protein
MFKHDHADENPLRYAKLQLVVWINQKKLINFYLRQTLYAAASQRYRTEGLNTVKYNVIETIATPLYTKFIVYYDEKEYMKNFKLPETTEEIPYRQRI